MRLNIIRYFVYIILVAIIIALSKRIYDLNKDRHRLRQNQVALLSNIEQVTDKYNREVAKVAAIQLSQHEFKDLNDNLTRTVNALNLKVKRLEAVIQTSTVTSDTIFIPIAPPVIRSEPTAPIIERPFSFHDGFTNIWGTVEFGDTLLTSSAYLNLKYSIVDTLDVVIYRVPKRFLFIPYGTKRIDCYIDSRNPNATVVVGSCSILKRAN